jgi:AraC-like DNA-binding protein
MLRRNEPLWRQISVMGQAETTELTTTRLIALFTRTIEFGLPSLLIGRGEKEGHESSGVEFPVRGTLTQSPLAQQVRQAVDLLRGRMAESWTAHRLSVHVATSRSHLTRLFNEQIGVAPMRFLTEVRLTEFTRLIEETELPVSSAARNVGWVDARIATRWYSRRFGITPSEYRQHPHPTIAEGSLDQTWRDLVGASDPGQRVNARSDP